MTLFKFDLSSKVGQPHDVAIHNVTVENLRWFYDDDDGDHDDDDHDGDDDDDDDNDDGIQNVTRTSTTSKIKIWSIGSALWFKRLHIAGQKTQETTPLHFSMLPLEGSSEIAT